MFLSFDKNSTRNFSAEVTISSLIGDFANDLRYSSPDSFAV